MKLFICYFTILTNCVLCSLFSKQEQFDVYLSSIKVNEKCLDDVTVWLQSIAKFQSTFDECGLFGKNCTKNQIETLNDNIFAIKELDSFGKIPAPGLLELKLIYDGSYTECINSKNNHYETNYCYTTIDFQKTCKGIASTAIRLATCFPESCAEQDISELVNKLPNTSFTSCQTFCTKHHIDKDASFWSFSIFLIVILIIIIFASIVDYCMDEIFKFTKKNDYIALKIILSFSLWTNASLVLSVKEQKPGFIKSLDCIRLMSMSWVVAGHAMIMFAMGDTFAPVIKVPTKFWNHLITNAVLSVDTFFVLSGIVVAYMFFKQPLSSRLIKSPSTWILFYIHRYLRLTPPIMLFIGFYIVYAPYIQGPVAASEFNNDISQIEACRKTWWKNLIYINNFGEMEDSCYSITWYLAVDTQLYLISPIILIGLFIAQSLGILLSLSGCVASIVIVYILYYINDYPADFVGNGNPSNFFQQIYEKPWIRCPPYLIGLIAGYFIAIYGKRKLRINWALPVIGWVTAFFVACACLFTNYDYDSGTHWSIFSRATFYNFSRIGWSFVICWVVIANHMGWGGPINNFMSHPIWQPFGRLSYCAYIVHWMVISYYNNLSDRPLHLNGLWEIYLYYAIPCTFISFVFAFVWSMLFEIPTLRLEKILIQSIMGHGKKEKENIKSRIGNLEGGIGKTTAATESIKL